MLQGQCLRCIVLLRKQSQQAHISRSLLLQRRLNSTESGEPSNQPSSSSDPPQEYSTFSTRGSTIDVSALLHQPTWSVRSLLPTASTPIAPSPSTNPSPAEAVTETISTQKLHHLLRLSALPPPPPDSTEEKSMLDTLHQQLHFVRSIQAIDTTGIEPLVAIRDETKAADAERTVGLLDPDVVRRLGEEKIIGRRRRLKWIREGQRTVDGGEMGGKKEKGLSMELEGWDPLSLAERKVGRYYVVDNSVSEVDTPVAAGASVENIETTEKRSV